MADICPNCNQATVQHGLDSAYCITCGRKITYNDDGTLVSTEDTVAELYAPADTSLATPTATPVYAERQDNRQPEVDTNREPIPTDAKPGVTTKPAPDLEAVNVAGELSDETPEEKKSGGPDDQPRTADLTKTGKPTKDTMVDHSTDEQVSPPEVTEEQVAAQNEIGAPEPQVEEPTEPRPGDPQTDQATQPQEGEV